MVRALQGDTPIALTGPSGTLEGRLMGESALDSVSNDGQLVALVCHPHSLHGGTMHNKVVHTLSRAFRDLGVPSVRFNFRGVGSSEGEYSEGIGETEDLLAVIEWVRQRCPRARLLIAGFSFGGFVASRGARKWVDAGQQLDGLILVAPAVGNFDFAGLLPVPAPTLVIQGGQDEVVAPQQVSAWLSELSPVPQQVWLDEAGHFFHGVLPELKTAVTRFLRQARLVSASGTDTDAEAR